MSPPAPIPEHEFEQFLQEHGCEGRATKKHHAAYRRSDGKRISPYAVRHGGSKREVLPVYRSNFISALKEIEANEREERKPDEMDESEARDQWKNASWYKKYGKKLQGGLP